jgi:hypothetical protein
LKTGLDKEGATSMTGTINSLMKTQVVQNASAAQAISSSLTSLVRASLVSLKPGEDALSISTSSVNMSNAIFYAATLANKTLSPPGTNNSVSLPAAGAAGFYGGVTATDVVSTAVMSIQQLKKDTPETASTSNVMRFSITTGSGKKTRRLQDGASDALMMDLQTLKTQHYSVSVESVYTD